MYVHTCECMCSVCFLSACIHMFHMYACVCGPDWPLLDTEVIESYRIKMLIVLTGHCLI